MASTAGESAVVRISPMETAFTEVAGGGDMNYSTHRATNLGKERVSVKIKCSDNDIYRLRPVFFFVEPGKTGEFTIGRILGKPLKKDKLVLLYASAVSGTGKDAAAEWLDKEKKGDGQVVMWVCRSGVAPGIAPSPVAGVKAPPLAAPSPKAKTEPEPPESEPEPLPPKPESLPAKVPPKPPHKPAKSDHKVKQHALVEKQEQLKLAVKEPASEKRTGAKKPPPAKKK